MGAPRRAYLGDRGRFALLWRPCSPGPGGTRRSAIMMAGQGCQRLCIPFPSSRPKPASLRSGHSNPGRRSWAFSPTVRSNRRASGRRRNSSERAHRAPAHRDLQRATVGRRPTRQGHWHAKPGDLTTPSRRERPLFSVSFCVTWVQVLDQRARSIGAFGQFALTDGARRPEAFWSAAMDLDELCMGPFDRIGRRHALDGLRVHVDDDVLGLHLGCILIGRPSIAPQPPGHRNLLERC